MCTVCAIALTCLTTCAALELEPLAFQRLPVGSIKPTGWLKNELQIAADGFSGYLCDFYAMCKHSTWTGGVQEAQNPEVLPYWLNGAVPLAFQTGDAHLKKVVGSLVDYILEHPTQDGLLGAPLIEPPMKSGKPAKFGNGTEYWSKARMMQALTQYAEANTSDTRIIPAMQRHWKAIGKHLETTPPVMWGASRWMDAALPMQWMMDHKLGDAHLDEALVSLRNQSVKLYDWQSRFLDDGPIWDWNTPASGPTPEADKFEKEMHHGVNLAQAIKLGAIWYRVSGDKDDLDNTAIALDRLDRLAGAPSGAYMSDELLTGPNTAARGTETCNVVEHMYSMEMAFAISGNLSYADRLERLAYNALPAALWPDIKANAYLQQTNQIEAKESEQHSWEHDGPKSTIYGLHRCCTSNFNQGWPKFTQSIVHISSDGGLAVPVYAPADASAPTVGGGATLSITTNYPFEDSVVMIVTSKKPFPLHLRIPSWVAGATVTVDGGAKQHAKAGTFFTVAAAGPKSKVVLQMQNDIRVVTGYNDSSVSVHRGPLLFAMDIGQKVKQLDQVVNEKGHAVADAAHTPGTDFHEYQCEATKPWNMALDVSTESLKYIGMKGSLPYQPFSPDSQTVLIKARGRQLPGWKAVNNSASPPPMSPVESAEPLQDLVFVPFGATNIRMAQLPTLSDKPATHQSVVV